MTIIKHKYDNRDKRGYWQYVEKQDEDWLVRRRYYCSVCGSWQTYGATRYCLDCGAKMEGCDKDETN